MSREIFIRVGMFITIEESQIVDGTLDNEILIEAIRNGRMAEETYIPDDFEDDDGDERLFSDAEPSWYLDAPMKKEKDA